MIIPALTDAVVIDEIPEKPKQSDFYLLSRPILVTPNFNEKQHNFKINTTRNIAGIMASKAQNPIPVECLHVMTKSTILDLVDIEKKVKVHIIETGSASGNVMFLFEFCDINRSSILYTGQFIESRVALLNKFVLESIRNNAINDLYFDASLANSSVVNDMTAVCDKICAIISKNPDYKIRLQLESLGYEDLLLKLACDYNIKIFLNKLRKNLMKNLKLEEYFKFSAAEAKITLFCGAIKSASEYEKLYQKKTITLQIIASEKSPYTFSDGLIQIPYCDHPTISELIQLIQLVGPKELHAIEAPYTFNAIIPDSLNKLVVVNDEVSLRNADLELSNGNISPSNSFLAMSSSSSASSEVSENGLHDAIELPDNLFQEQESESTQNVLPKVITGENSSQTEAKTEQKNAIHNITYIDLTLTEEPEPHSGQLNVEKHQAVNENGEKTTKNPDPEIKTEKENQQSFNNSRTSISNTVNQTTNTSVPMSANNTNSDRNNNSQVSLTQEEPTQHEVQEESSIRDPEPGQQQQNSLKRSNTAIQKRIGPRSRKIGMIPEKKKILQYHSDSDKSEASDESITMLPEY